MNFPLNIFIFFFKFFFFVLGNKMQFLTTSFALSRPLRIFRAGTRLCLTHPRLFTKNLRGFCHTKSHSVTNSNNLFYDNRLRQYQQRLGHTRHIIVCDMVFLNCSTVLQ